MQSSKLILLPCEIYHREFDAKLILATHLASLYGYSVLIGCDKHFNFLAPYLRQVLLLEKSCSSIMWASRIKNVLSLSGEVVVADEEGFNNIIESNSYAWSVRLDLEAASAINLYACWGSIDYEFFSRFKELRPKLSKLGNCRSDLLGDSGKMFYHQLSSSLKTIFGPFVLCVDNFAIEHRDGAYAPPHFEDKSDDENKKAQKEYAFRMADQVARRKQFLMMVRQSALNNPNLNYVIRPHPTSDYRWWSNHLWDLRNVHIIYKHNVDAWIHAAQAVISMGCTTSIQSIVASTPVIEIKPEFHASGQNAGYAHKYTKLNVENVAELDTAISFCFEHPDDCFKDRYLIERDWNNSLSECASSIFADVFHHLASPSAHSFDKNIAILEQYSGLRRKTPLVLSSTKWCRTSFATLDSVHQRISDSFSLKSVNASKVCDDLFLISP